MDTETLKEKIISEIIKLNDDSWYQNPNDQNTFIAQLAGAYTVKVSMSHGNNLPFATICNVVLVHEQITTLADRLNKIRKERIERREIESIHSIARGLGFKF